MTCKLLQQLQQESVDARWSQRAVPHVLHLAEVLMSKTSPSWDIVRVMERSCAGWGGRVSRRQGDISGTSRGCSPL